MKGRAKSGLPFPKIGIIPFSSTWSEYDPGPLLKAITNKKMLHCPMEALRV
jgi:hypothetical protein